VTFANSRKNTECGKLLGPAGIDQPGALRSNQLQLASIVYLPNEESTQKAVPDGRPSQLVDLAKVNLSR
jgi:hypothetical protein